MASSIFSKIVSGEIPCYKVAENKDFLAFLDIFPLEKGHTIVIPKIETDYIFDLDKEHYSNLFLFAKSVAEGIKSVIPCKKVGIAVVGLEIPHAHIHLVPLKTGLEINFQREKLKLLPSEFQEIANSVSKAVLL